MRLFVAGVAALLVAFAGLSPASGMAPLYDDTNADIAPFNELVEQQNAAVREGTYDRALELNAQMMQIVDPIEAVLPGTKGMILYDRAVILTRKGDPAGALAVFDQAYAKGDLQAIGEAYVPLDYYGTAMTAYVTALRNAGRPEWREVQTAFVEALYGKEGNHRLSVATWANIAMSARKDAGEVDVAAEMCARQIEWFEGNPQLATPRGFAAVGRPTVFVADAVEPGFITGLALRQGRYEADYAFVRADLEDTCGAIKEVAGDLEAAIAHRRASLDWIRKQDNTSYFRVIQLRLARVLAFQGNDQLASQYLDLALKGYGLVAGEGDSAAEVCAGLGFVLDGKPRSANDVLRQFRSAPLSKGVLGDLSCAAE